MQTSNFDPVLFREVLGQYPTGVAVITALSATGDALGMTVGSFTSVSLEPPLVAFLPSKSSSSWAALKESGERFCVNVLSAQQEQVCRDVAIRKSDKFVDIDWEPSPAGNPLIDGAVAHIDCKVTVIHDAGDHEIVVAEVESLGMHAATYPLLFFRGGYGSFAPLSLAVRDATLIRQLKSIDAARGCMQELAERFNTEVAAMALVGNELVLAATSGSAPGAVTPTRVGQRLPFMPPLGSVFAAWGDDDLRDAWIANAADIATPAELDHYRETAAGVRARGYAVAFGPREVARLERTWARLNDGDPTVSRKNFLAELKRVSRHFNPTEIDARPDIHLRSVGAPVFDPDGSVAFTLTMWSPDERVSSAKYSEITDALLSACSEATRALGSP